MIQIASSKTLSLEGANIPDASLDEIVQGLIFDSDYPGHFRNNGIYTENDALYMHGKKVNIYSERDPTKIPWKGHLAIDSTGVFKDTVLLRDHIGQARKVILTAPPKDDMPIIAPGVNNSYLSAVKNDEIFSGASCTSIMFANALKAAILLHGLDDILFVVLSLDHSYTKSDELSDDKFRAKGHNAILSTSTGSGKCVIKILPELKNKLIENVRSVRVPVSTGCIGGFTLITKNQIKYKSANELLKAMEQKVESSDLKGQIGFDYSSDREQKKFRFSSASVVKSDYFCVMSNMTQIGSNSVSYEFGTDNRWSYTRSICKLSEMIADTI